MKVRGLAFAALMGLASCSGGATHDAPRAGPLGLAFEVSARSSGVPRDLMVAVAQVEGGLLMPLHRIVDPEADVPAAGPIELRHGRFNSLARGAALMGLSELALRQDADLALSAGARVLAEVGGRTGADAADLATWQGALEEMSGYADEPHRIKYAHRVFALLARGGAFDAREGETVTLPAHGELPPTLTLDVATDVHPLAGPEYPGAQWFPTDCTNKCDPTRNGFSVTMIAIHDTEGGWEASVATLQNDPGKSVHYIVNTDGTVGQFIPESYTGWHVGNYWYNEHMVGIEHVGYYTQPYPDALYAASAELVAYLTSKYGVPLNRTHIIGHDQVPNGTVMAEDSPPCEDTPAACETGTGYGGANNHRDPGDWQWAIYMPRFGGTAKCNDMWPIWNCSSDHTEAFRCVNNNIEIEQCNGPGGCVSQPAGADDVCNQAPGGTDAGVPPPPPPPPPGSDASALPSGMPPPNPAQLGSSPVTPAPPAGGGDIHGSTGSSGGCSAAPPSRAPVSVSFDSALLLGLALGIRRRRTR
jgi:hypothetical protein